MGADVPKKISGSLFPQSSTLVRLEATQNAIRCKIETGRCHEGEQTVLWMLRSLNRSEKDLVSSSRIWRQVYLLEGLVKNSQVVNQQHLRVCSPQLLDWSNLKALQDAIERKVDQVRCHGGEQSVPTGADASKSIRER